MGASQQALLMGSGAPLDSFTSSLWGAYGLARLVTAYSGSAIRVRRSSDSTEQDIGFIGSSLDTASLASFVTGTGYGYIVKWYDQSGGGNDLNQTTTGRQPVIVFYGTYLACVLNNDTDDGLPSTNNVPSGSVFTLFMLGSDFNSAASGSLAEIGDGFINSGNQFRCSLQNHSTQVLVATGAASKSRSYADYPTAASVFATVIDSQQSVVGNALLTYSNSTLNTQTSSVADLSVFNLTANKVCIGSSQLGARGKHFNWSTFVIYTTNKSAGDVASIAASILASGAPTRIRIPVDSANLAYSANPLLKLTEASGNFADTSANARTGTVTGTITRSSSALFANTTGGCEFVAANSADVNYTNANGNANAFVSYSARFVIKVPSLASAVRVWSQGVSTGNDNLVINTDGSMTWVHVQGNSTVHTQTTAAGVITTGTSYDIVLVWNYTAGTLNIYVDTAAVQVTDFSATLASTSTRINAEGLYLGRTAAGYGSFILEDHMFTTSVLTIEQIENMYDSLGAKL